MNKISDWIADFIKFTIVTTGLILIGWGIAMIVQWGYSNTTVLSAPTTDSTISKTNSTDTAKKSLTTSSTIVYHAEKLEQYNANVITLKDNMLKKAYDFITFGIILLLTILILPSLSSISILSLFSATFKEKLDAAKTLLNDTTNSVNTNFTGGQPALTKAKYTDEQKSHFISRLNIDTSKIDSIIKYVDDPQKEKWGGSPVSNNRKISASVFPLGNIPQVFKIVVSVISTDIDRALKGKVIFHLHPSFPNPSPEIYVVHGEAKLELIAWGAFTIGAEADNKSTKLELDLSELPDAPVQFNAN